METILFDKETLMPVVKAFAEHKHGVKVDEIKKIGGGGMGMVFELTYADRKTEILKAFRVSGMLQAEAETLVLLKKASSIKVPAVFYTHQADDQCPVDLMAMERIDGIAARDLPLFLPAKKCRQIAENVASALKEIHQMTAQTYGVIGRPLRYDTWQEFYKILLADINQRAAIFCTQNETRMSGKIFSFLEAGIDNIDYILAEPVEKPSLLHGDLWIENLLFDPKTYLPIGILDPLNAMWGDPEYDLFPLNAPWGKRFRLYQTYKRMYKTSERVDLKTAFYYLASEVNCSLQLGTWADDAFYEYLLKNLKKQFRKHGIL